MNIGDRSRVRLLDKLAKQNGWRSLCIVGVKDDLEAKSLIQWCRQLDVTLIWEQHGGTRQERQRQQMGRDRMRKWTGIYKRLSLVEMSSAEAAEHLADRQYDAVALWGLSPAQLAADGAKWAALVRDGGSLVGTGHRLPEVRSILNAAVDKWRQLRDGVWLVDVRRGEAGDEPAAIADDDAAVLINGDVSDVVGATADAAEAYVAHDPVDSGPSADEAVQGGAPPAGAEGELGEADIDHVAGPARRGKQRKRVGGKPASAAAVADSPDAALSVGGSELHSATIAQPAPKRRGGRPKGSRNNPKVTSEA